MGLSSSMYTGVSGLKGHGEKMGTIGNNISNVSTVGFKGSRMHFEDFMSQDINTGAGVGQVGRGVGIGAVMNDFSQGSLESTNEATDVAIGGKGFFQVSPRGTDENLFTRAGNFRFDDEGYLVDPNNNIVQGWEVRQDPPGVADEDDIIQTDTGVEIMGAPGDIRLDDFQSPPEQTRKVDQMVNLDSRSPVRSTGETEILRGDDDEGTEGYLRIGGVDREIELQDDEGDADVHAGDGVIGVWNEDDEEFDDTVFAYVDGDIVYDPDDDHGQAHQLRWDSEAEDYALWDETNDEWAIEGTNFDESEDGGETLVSEFGNADLERGGSIEIDYEEDGDDADTIEIEFDNSADLIFQLNELEVVDSAVYDAEANTVSISVVEDIDEEAITNFTINEDELLPKTASHYDVVAYTEPGYPFSAMFNNWDATADEPLGDARFAYQSTMKVYDENGTSYELTNYFDPVDVDDPAGNNHWEYMTTVSPEHDNREGMEESEKRGVLMTGSLTFNPGGELIGQSAFTLGDAVYDDDGVLPGVAGTDFAADMENWTRSDFSENGYPVFTPNFLGVEGQSHTGADGAHNIEMNFGLRNRSPNWSQGAADNPAELGMVVDDDYDQSFRSSIPNFADQQREAQASTQYSSSSTTLMQNQDGYTTGFLQNIEIDRNGVLTGRYDNGQIMDLYALTLADFHNEQGLRKEGGNLFSETRSSGPAMTGLAGTRGLGEISSNSLEMSNVDLASEFVKLIQTEKGFQANSKTIQTTDTMLGIIMQMKR